MTDKPFAVIEVLCDPKRVQRVALTCKCDNRWTELVPGELHDAGVAMRFHCSRCGQVYIVVNHQLIREDQNGGQKQATLVGAATDTTKQFDA